MRATIRDPGIFRSLNHRDVRAYLHTQGWKDIGTLGDRAYVLGHADKDGEEWELLLPARPTVSDYTTRMAEAVSILAKVEGRSELSLITDLSLAGVDVVRIGAPNANSEGTIPVETGVAMYEQAKAMLLSAACAAHDPRPSYHIGKITEAVSYLNTVRLGQTERGSYVLTLLSPVDPSLGNAQPVLAPEFEDDPFSRKVTRKLAEALDRLNHAIIASGGAEGFQAFESAVPSGVSANLCEAVAGLVEGGGGAGIALTWARTRPAPGANPKIDFTADAAGVLREAGREFRKRAPKTDMSLSGWVVALAREPQEFDGNATLRVLLEGERRPRNIRATFAPADYTTVVRAFQDKLLISLE